MSNLNFDLNIYNYTKSELLMMLQIQNNYSIEELHKKIIILEKKITDLQLSSKEKTEIFLFLKIIEITLTHDLEKKIMLEKQEMLHAEIKSLQKKIKKNK